MRLHIDECMSRHVVRLLREAGHDVTWAAEAAPGDRDENVLRKAVAESRVLITEDYDYGGLIFRDGHSAFGVVIVALDENDDDQIAEHIVRQIADLGDARLFGRFTTLERTRTRQRDLPAVADRT